MKKLILYILLLTSTIVVAQTPRQLPAFVTGKGTLSQVAAASGTVDIRIAFSDETMMFDGTGLDNTCVLLFYNTDDSRGYELPVTTVVTPSSSNPVIRVNITGFPALNGAINGQGVCYKKNGTNHVTPYVSGITNSLQQVISEAISRDNETNIITAGGEILKTISTLPTTAYVVGAVKEYQLNNGARVLAVTTSNIWRYIGVKSVTNDLLVNETSGSAVIDYGQAIKVKSNGDRFKYDLPNNTWIPELGYIVRTTGTMPSVSFTAATSTNEAETVIRVKNTTTGTFFSWDGSAFAEEAIIAETKVLAANPTTALAKFGDFAMVQTSTGDTVRQQYIKTNTYKALSGKMTALPSIYTVNGTQTIDYSEAVIALKGLSTNTQQTTNFVVLNGKWIPQKGRLDNRDFGTVGDGITDDAPALQRYIDYCLYVANYTDGICNIVSGQYLLNKQLNIGYGDKFVSLVLQGAGRSPFRAEVSSPVISNGGTTLIANFQDNQACINIQAARGVTIRDIGMVAKNKIIPTDQTTYSNIGSWIATGYSTANRRYSPNAGVSIDGYTSAGGIGIVIDTSTTKAYKLPTIPTYLVSGGYISGGFTPSYNLSGSIDVHVYNCQITGFYVGVVQSPLGDSQGDGTYVEHCLIEGAYGISICNSQSRMVKSSDNYLNCWTGLSNRIFGAQRGTFNLIENTHFFGYQAFNIGTYQYGQTQFNSCYSEQMVRLGEFNGAVTSMATVTFNDCQWATEPEFIKVLQPFIVNNSFAKLVFNGGTIKAGKNITISNIQGGLQTDFNKVTFTVLPELGETSYGSTLDTILMRGFLGVFSNYPENIKINDCKPNTVQHQNLNTTSTNNSGVQSGTGVDYQSYWTNDYTRYAYGEKDNVNRFSSKSKSGIIYSDYVLVTSKTITGRTMSFINTQIADNTVLGDVLIERDTPARVYRITAINTSTKLVTFQLMNNYTYNNTGAFVSYSNTVTPSLTGDFFIISSKRLMPSLNIFADVSGNQLINFKTDAGAVVSVGNIEVGTHLYFGVDVFATSPIVTAVNATTGVVTLNQTATKDILKYRIASDNLGEKTLDILGRNNLNDSLIYNSNTGNAAGLVFQNKASTNKFTYKLGVGGTANGSDDEFGLYRGTSKVFAYEAVRNTVQYYVPIIMNGNKTIESNSNGNAQFNIFDAASNMSLSSANDIVFLGQFNERTRMKVGGNWGFNIASPLYQIDIDAITGKSGNPIRAQGLLAGTRTDSLVTEVSGVFKRLSVDEVLGTNFTTTYNTAIAAGAEATISVTITSLTTATGLVGLSWSGTKQTGLVIMPVELTAGTAIIHVLNTTGGSLTPNLTLNLKALRL